MKNLITRISAALATLSIAASPLAFGSQVATAATNSFNLTVPINTVKTGPNGSRHILATKAVEQAYRGMQCSAHATAKNQESVHPNNDLEVASNGSHVTLKNVERAGGILTTADGTLTLGSDVTVTLVMGPDTVFSGGLDVNITCEDPSIEVCRDGMIKTIKKSERKSTDTNAPCPTPEFEASIICKVKDEKAVFTLKATQTSGDSKLAFNPANGTTLTNGNEVTVIGTYNDGKGEKAVKTIAPAKADCTPEKVNVCRDGKVISILKAERKSTDSDAPCPVEKIKVCRDNKQIEIAKTDRKNSDTDAPCPEVKGATTLPNTGAGSIAGLIGATFIGGTVLSQFRMRRSSRQ